MRFIWFHLALAALLLLTAFVLPQTPLSMGVLLAAGIAVAGLAIAAGGKPAVRYTLAAIAVGLAFLMLLLPGISGAGRVASALIAAALFALSLATPRHAEAGAHHPAPLPRM